MVLAFPQSGRLETLERMTADEFFLYAPEDQPCELIDGVLRMSPPPLDTHERQNLSLLRLLSEFVELHNLGEVRGSRTAVRLSEAHVFEPDVLFVARARENLITERGVMGAPDLVVEILSAATAVFDRGDKFRAYERYGVQEVWLIDPYGPAGTEFYQRQGEFLRPVAVDAAGWLVSTAVAGFRLQMAWLWPGKKFIPVQQALAAMG